MIETRIKKCEGYDNTYDVVVPVVKPGDRVELSGWDSPVVGTVLETDQKLVWCDVPVATPGGGALVTSVFEIKRLWRGSDYWESANEPIYSASILITLR